MLKITCSFATQEEDRKRGRQAGSRQRDSLGLEAKSHYTLCWVTVLHADKESSISAFLPGINADVCYVLISVVFVNVFIYCSVSVYRCLPGKWKRLSRWPFGEGFGGGVTLGGLLCRKGAGDEGVEEVVEDGLLLESSWFSAGGWSCQKLTILIPQNCF